MAQSSRFSPAVAGRCRPVVYSCFALAEDRSNADQNVEHCISCLESAIARMPTQVDRSARGRSAVVTSLQHTVAYGFRSWSLRIVPM